MTDQRCGNCRYYEPDETRYPIGEHGWCDWTEDRIFPWYLDNHHWVVCASDDKQCPTWMSRITPESLAKETKHA